MTRKKGKAALNVGDRSAVDAAEASVACVTEAELDDDSGDVEGEGDGSDVAFAPGPSADAFSEVSGCIDPEVLKLYDVYSYQHAAAILKNSFPTELLEIENALLNFKLSVRDIGNPGGNESDIPKKLSAMLRPAGWLETRIQGDLVVRLLEQGESILPSGKTKKYKLPEKEHHTIKGYIDGHKIDYVKGRVSVDLEWNSKDQTYDRDLYACRIFHECKVISIAVLITRSEKLNDIFPNIPQLSKNGSIVYNNNGKIKSVKSKYGASTTWMGKLLYRLNAGRHGGCPVLVFGIRPDIVTDYTIGQTLEQTVDLLKEGKNEGI